MSSAGSGLLALWKPTHGKHINTFKGQTHTTNCLEIIGDQLISASTNGNVIIHDSFEVTVRKVACSLAYLTVQRTGYSYAANMCEVVFSSTC